MKISNEQFDEAYEKATPAQQYLCSYSGGQLLSIANKYNLNEEEYKNLAITIGDVVLGFFPKTELPNLLVNEVGLNETNAFKITGELMDFFNPLTDPSWQPPKNNTENDLEEVGLSVQEEIAEAEAALKSLRTMADDELAAIDSEKVHPSQQADLLNKESGPSPRWGSG